MKRFTVLAIALMLALSACGNQKVHTSPSTDVTVGGGNHYDRLGLPDGTTVALGDHIDPGRFTPMGTGHYQIKAAYAATVVVNAGAIVGIVSPGRYGGTIDGFIFGSTPDGLDLGFHPAVFDGQPSFARSIAGGKFYAIESGCPAGHLNLVALVAEGHQAAVEDSVTVSPCDPARERD